MAETPRFFGEYHDSPQSERDNKRYLSNNVAKHIRRLASLNLSYSGDNEFGILFLMGPGSQSCFGFVAASSDMFVAPFPHIDAVDGPAELVMRRIPFSIVDIAREVPGFLMIYHGYKLPVSGIPINIEYTNVAGGKSTAHVRWDKIGIPYLESEESLPPILAPRVQ